MQNEKRDDLNNNKTNKFSGKSVFIAVAVLVVLLAGILVVLNLTSSSPSVNDQQNAPQNTQQPVSESSPSSSPQSTSTPVGQITYKVNVGGKVLSGSNVMKYDEEMAAAGKELMTEELKQFIEEQLTNTHKKALWLGYPSYTQPDGTWVLSKNTDWRAGFFPGCLWYMYEWTGNEDWGRKARTWTATLESEKNNTNTHDVGFKMITTFLQSYRFTEDEKHKDVVLKGAESLATRYNPTVGLIQSWNPRKTWDYPVIIDNMMNLELLLWASQNGGKKEYYDMAVSHAEKTMQNHFREDGSTYHVVDYNVETGGVDAKNTHQGYADESTWSRGQAWAIYGFTMVYRYTKDERFLKTAQRAADYYIANLPEDYVPYWDFNAPDIPDAKRDSSAAAIAASGLLELSQFVKESKAENAAELAQKYKDVAINTLRSLTKNYLAKGTSNQGILIHGVGNMPSGGEIDVSLIYGDYYYLEALMRLKNAGIKQ